MQDTEVIEPLPQTNWVVAGADCIGAIHIKHQTPKEDHHTVQEWSNGWGIAIASDGAASCELAATGSRLIAQEYAPKLFQTRLSEYVEGHTTLTSELWEQISYQVLLESIRFLAAYADAHGNSVHEYGCTVIVMVYSPYGLFCSHIGDGRACYRDESGEWHACMKPYNPDPENPSITVFITSNIWETPELTKDYLESRTIEGATAFALLTDGVESYCFTCTPRDYETGDDPNLPSPAFFEPIYQNCTAAGLDAATISQDMAEYLSSAPRISQEVDDKTLIFGYLCRETCA